MQLVATRTERLTPLPTLAGMDQRAAREIADKALRPDASLVIWAADDRAAVLRQLENQFIVEKEIIVVGPDRHLTPGTPAGDTSPDFSACFSLIAPQSQGCLIFLPVDAVLRKLPDLALCQLAHEEFVNEEGHACQPLTIRPDTGKLALSLPRGITGTTVAGRDAMLQLWLAIQTIIRTGPSFDVLQSPGMIIGFDPHAFLVHLPRNQPVLVFAQLKRPA